MKSVSYLAAALMTAMTLSGGHALANICRTDKLTCSTSMPVQIPRHDGGRHRGHNARSA
jgi:hypothetical protein